jgi:Zn-dependent peptidase ImmA (M78 family)
MTDLKSVFEAQLLKYGVAWCRGCGITGNSHKRGFATPDDKTVHYDREIATRKTLYGGLHEIGHVVRGHGEKCRLRRFEQEREAEEFAARLIRELGISVPRSCVARGREYVERMKRWGSNIAAGRSK